MRKSRSTRLKTRIPDHDKKRCDLPIFPSREHQLPNSRTIDQGLSCAAIMSNAHYSDTAVTKLRAIVDAIEREIVHVPPTAALQTAWTELVEALALGPAPQTRECPACHGIGMRAASRCGNCWAALEPLLPLSDGTPLRGDA